MVHSPKYHSDAPRTHSNKTMSGSAVSPILFKKRMHLSRRNNKGFARENKCNKTQLTKNECTGSGTRYCLPACWMRPSKAIAFLVLGIARRVMYSCQLFLDTIHIIMQRIGMCGGSGFSISPRQSCVCRRPMRCASFLGNWTPVPSLSSSFTFLLSILYPSSFH